MTINPSEYVLTVHSDRYRTGLHARADRDRLARLAEQRAERQAWTDLGAVIAVVLALALLLATGSAAAQEPLPQAQPSLTQAARAMAIVSACAMRA